MFNDQTAQERAQDAQTLRECGAHKLVITDSEGKCLAYVLAWGSLGYDPETDTYLCCAASDSRELLNIYTEGTVKADPATGTFVVTGPCALAPENGFPRSSLEFS